MTEHGLLRIWKVTYQKRHRELGVCRYDIRTLSFARTLVALGQPWLMMDVLLHEIAHALAGPGHGHGPKWRQIAKRIGARVTVST